MRRNWGKKVLMSGLVASMLCGLAGPLNVSADDVTTVEYLFWGNQSEINTIMGTIDAFNKSHTDIQVKGTGIDPSVYLQLDIGLCENAAAGGNGVKLSRKRHYGKKGPCH